MISTFPVAVELARLVTGPFASPPESRCGACKLVHPDSGVTLTVIFTDGREFPEREPTDAWEHVSVSCRQWVPRWDEMQWVKGLFFGDDECVVQFHVPAADHVNVHSNCLHLWKWRGGDFPRPPQSAV